MNAVDPPGLNFVLNLHAGFVFSGFEFRSMTEHNQPTSVKSKTDQNCFSKLTHCKLHQTKCTETNSYCSYSSPSLIPLDSLNTVSYTHLTLPTKLEV